MFLTMFFHLFLSSIMFVNTGESMLITNLNAVLDYGIFRQNNDWNFLLGVSIAQAQVRVIKRDAMEMVTSKIHDMNLLEEKCNYLLSQVMKEDDTLAKALSASLWTLDSPLTSLSPEYFLHDPTSIAKLAESGMLTRQMSDDCLRSLLGNCSVPQNCLMAQLSSDASGYILTHQILFWTLFHRKCSNGRYQTFAKAVILEKCRHVFSQHQTIALMGFPTSLRDLYIEQVVVCGLHGFEQFLTNHNRDFLLSLQTSEGCFSSQNTATKTKCEGHLSGVSAAALALFLKYKEE